MTINPQSQVRFGLAVGESAGAAVWADPRAGIAAVAFGGASASHADVLFSRLARLSDIPGAVAQGGYPPRVIKSASVLETLHRELWQLREQGHSAMTLGVGVLVLHETQVYFLQIGPVQLLHVSGAAIREVAGVGRTAPLLGMELKGGIGVFNVGLTESERVIARVIEPIEAAPTQMLAQQIVGAWDQDAAAHAVLGAASTTQAVLALAVAPSEMPSYSPPPPPTATPSAPPVFETPAMPVSTPAVPPVMPEETMPPVAPPAHEVPPETFTQPDPPASPSDEDWFEEEVVGELSGYMSALQQNPEQAPPQPQLPPSPPAAPEPQTLDVELPIADGIMPPAVDPIEERAPADQEPAIVPPALGSGSERDYTDEDVDAFMDGVDDESEDLFSGYGHPEPGGLSVSGDGTDVPHGGVSGEEGLELGAESMSALTTPDPSEEPSDAETAFDEGDLVSVGAQAEAIGSDEDSAPAVGRERREGTSYGKAILTIAIVLIIAVVVILRPDRLLLSRDDGPTSPQPSESAQRSEARTQIAERGSSARAAAPISPSGVLAAPDAALSDLSTADGADGEGAANEPVENGADAAPDTEQIEGEPAPTGEPAGAEPAAADGVPGAPEPDDSTDPNADPDADPTKMEQPAATESAPEEPKTATDGASKLEVLPELYMVTILGPSGGKVEIDGELLEGETPASEIVLDAGVHTIRVDYGRLGVWAREVDVDTEAMRIDATPRGHVRFDVASAAGQIEVLLNGKSLGTNPATLHAVDAGEHSIAFKGVGVSGLDSSILVACSDTVLVTVPSAPVGEALIVVTSRRFHQDHFEETEGDSIWVDRTFAGLTPREVTVTPGIHGVRVRASQNRDQVTRIVDLPASAIRVVRADFGGEKRLTIEHRPLSEAKAGDSLLLPVVASEAGAPAAETITCHFRVDEVDFQERPLTRAGDGTDRWVVSLEGYETDGRRLEYYFSALDTDGVSTVSEVYHVLLQDTPAQTLAENS